MKSSFWRLLANTLLLAFVIGLVIACAGWLFGWNTPVQYSNGFFGVGGILVVIGILSVMGGFGARADSHMLFSQSAGSMDINERNQRLVSDMTQGYQAFIFLFMLGGLLIALAVLTANIF